MSDFLKGFDKDNYQKKQVEEKDPNPIQDSTKVDPTAASDSVNDKAPAAISATGDDELLTPPKTRTVSKHEPEEVEIDPGYRSKKKRQTIIIAILLVLLAGTAWWLYYVNVNIVMPDFAGKAISEARSWANANNITLTINQQYSLEYDTNTVIEQGLSAGQRIRKGRTLDLGISIGADPEEIVTIPDLMMMDQQDVAIWIETHKLTNVYIYSEYSDTVVSGAMIRYEIRDTTVNETTFKRKDMLNVYFSQGSEVFEKNITVTDFSNKTQLEVEQWRTDNRFTVDFTYSESYDNIVEAGFIVSQSVSPDTKVSRADTLHFVISKGKAITMPNYSSTTINSFDAVDNNGLNIQVRERYSVSVAYGSFLNQTVASGTNLSERPTVLVEVFYSIGKPYVKGLVGEQENDLAPYFYDFSYKGASITYTTTYANSCEAKGTVIAADKENQYVAMSEVITITVSNGICLNPEE